MKNFLKSVKGKVITACVAVAVAAAVLIVIFTAGETGYRNISISEVYGNVTVDNGDSIYQAYKNMQIGGGYTLTTKTDSYTRMLLDEDKYIKLEQDSCAVFRELGTDSKRNTVIDLQYGAIINEIVNPLNEDEGYIVNTPNAVLAVRGTFFRIEARYDDNGEVYTDVYTFGGSVTCKRIMPDGTQVEEQVSVNAGYKACIKMDEIITVYVEEKIEWGEDHVDPIELDKIHDNDLVDIYNASLHGHEMFEDPHILWREIKNRDIDLSQYVSVYDGEEIKEYQEQPLQTSSLEEITSAEGTTAQDAPAETTSEQSDTEETAVTDWTTAVPVEPEPWITEEITGSDTADGEAATNHQQTTTVQTEKTVAVSESEHTEGTVTETERTEETVAETERTEETTAETELTEETTVETEQTEETTTQTSAVVHSHTYSGYVSNNDATCTENGTKTATCNTCGESITVVDVGSATGHTTEEINTDPTFTVEGVRLVYCTACGEEIEKEYISRIPLYTEDGNIIITSTGFTQGSATEETAWTGDYVISQKDGTTAVDCAITVESGTHNVTLDGVNITREAAPLVISGGNVTLTGGGDNTLSASGSLQQIIKIASGAVLSFDGGGCYISVSGTSNYGIFNDGGMLEINGGYINITSTDYSSIGIHNGGTNIQKGGSVVFTGVSAAKQYDSNYIITGGSLKDTSPNGYSNGTDTLECIVCDTFPTEAERTFTSSDGTSYTYALEETDMADDGKYYVWKPMDSSVAINDVNFPDDVFRTYVSDNFDSDSNGYLSDTEIAAVTRIKVSGDSSADGGVASLQGIEYFTELTTLSCYYNSGLTEIDVSNNIALTYLGCHSTAITSLDVSKNAALITLDCQHTTITNLDVSKNTALKMLCCSNTAITSLDVSNNIALEELYCYNTAITSLDVSKNTALTTLTCSDTAITSLDVSSNTALIVLNCPYTAITNLDVSNNIALEDLWCDNTAITSLDVSNNTALKMLHCNDTAITSLNVSKNTALEELWCYNTAITSLDVSNNTALEWLHCYNTAITSLDVSKNTALTHLDCSNTNITSLHCSNTAITSLDVSSNTALKALYCDYTALTSLDLSNNTALERLLCYNTAITSLDVSKNTALEILWCNDTAITSLDVSNNTALKVLYCYNTAITSLDVSGNAALKVLYCYNTAITSLDVSNNVALTELVCHITSIESLDLSNNTALTRLNCLRTAITSLDVSKNTALTHLDCSNTNITSLDCSNTAITSLDVSSNTALEELWCNNTAITSLDVSNNTALTTLTCGGCNLPYIDVTNNTSLTSFSADANQYPIPSNADTFDASAIPGFDASKVSDVANADFDSTTGVFSNITADVTYTYDCGQGYSETFTLTRTGAAAFDGTLYIDDGNIAITSTGFIQGDATEETAWTGDYVISQRSADAVEGKIRIESGTHNITLDGLNIENPNDSSTLTECLWVGVDAEASINCGDKESVFCSDQFAGIIADGVITFEGGTLTLNQCAIYDENTFIMNGGAITVNAAGECGISCGDSFQMNGGTLTVTGGNTAAVDCVSDGSFVMNGGTAQFSSIDSCDVRIDSGFTFTVNGGSLKLVNGLIGSDGAITNSDGEALYAASIACTDFTTVTITDESGTPYTGYAVNAVHSDGYAYIWLPERKYTIVSDGITYTVTVTSTGTTIVIQ